MLIYLRSEQRLIYFNRFSKRTFLVLNFHSFLLQDFIAVFINLGVESGLLLIMFNDLIEFFKSLLFKENLILNELFNSLFFILRVNLFFFQNGQLLKQIRFFLILNLLEHSFFIIFPLLNITLQTFNHTWQSLFYGFLWSYVLLLKLIS